jgi:hypothetical protein
MMGLGFAEILMLLFLSGGGMNTDLASLLPAPTYFKSRGIDISVEKAAELAGKDPVDGKAQIGQLVALKYLADEAVKLKSSPNYEQHRQLLAAIAAGKKANDPQGFAKEYADAVLTRLDGKTVTAAAPAAALRDDAARWFPANANILAALDTRMAGAGGLAKSNFGEMFKMFPQEMLQTAFGVVEKIGNVRIDRIAFAFVEDPAKQRMGEIYVRFTGKANPAWLLEGFKELNMPTKSSQGPKGESITTLLKPNQAPALALIGDTDLVLAGFENNQANHEDLITKVLELRAGKLQNAGAGALKTELAKIPEKACGLVVGRVPGAVADGAPFPMPVMVNGHMLRVRNALDFKLAGSMANNDDAEKLVATVSQFRTQGINGLKQLQGAPVPIPGLQIGSMIEMLESMQIEAQGNVANLRMLMPQDVLGGGSLFFGMRAGPVAPPPAKK